ncbi:ankyrin repeat and SOCS box protein 8-like isoform X2 [Heptranchias perlo]|uniref:ankyrin repeat and SOCS box protein 8-like isoform X1 n=1 Tax=Heptranchias perlo TaxID=212740 RepID=UPI00355A27F5
MWYVMQSIQSKYSLSERLIRAIGVRSFPHDSVELLINRVNATDGYHRAALHYAAEKDVSCVEILLEFGADPNAPDGNMDTPLHWASFKDSHECVRLLLENGARVEAADYNQDTPLSWAASRGNLESTRVLLEYGAQVRVVNLKGQTPVSRLLGLLSRGLGGEREEDCLRLLGQAAGGGIERRGEGADPGSLKGLSRYAVRQCLGAQHLPAAVESLPLPGSVKEYLLLVG